MHKMKVLWAVLLALVGFGFPAGAVLLGVPDDAPARRIVVPFFDLSVEGTEDFLVAVENTWDSDVSVHAVVYDRDTNHAYDFNMRFTAGDLEGFSIRTLIANMPSSSRGQLVVEEEGKRFYRGEIMLDVSVVDTGGEGEDPFGASGGNVLVCSIYWIDVPLGALSGFNALHVQYGTVSDLFRNGASRDRLTDENGFEVFTADALRDIEDAVRNGTVTQAGPNSLDFFVRYFIPDTDGSDATLVLWSATADEGYGLTFLIYDEEENVVSTFISAPHQVNLFAMRDTIPGGFTTPEGHRSGWIRIRSDDRAVMMWMRERMVGLDGAVFEGVRRVPRSLVYR